MYWVTEVDLWAVLGHAQYEDFNGIQCGILKMLACLKENQGKIFALFPIM